jgi:16S rRNA G966 N2-methylase RsmD
MSDIVKRTSALPEKIEDLTKFVLIGREKLTAVRAYIKAIDKVGIAKGVRGQKMEEAQMLAGALLDAEARIGELLPKAERLGSTRGTKWLPEGITKKQSHFFQTLADNKDVIEEVKADAEIEEDLPTRMEVLRRVKEREKENRVIEEKIFRSKETDNIKIRKGDFKQVLSDVYDIDAIITDPPYPYEFINSFSELGEYAKEHLKKDGFIAIYSGQYHLPEVIKRLSEHLTYVWTFCLYHIGKKQLVNGVNIMCGWKPVLIFSNGSKKMRFSAYDVLISEAREKSSHEWQQSESGVAGLIEILSKPEDLIVDPFAGSGTFGVMSLKMGRRFIGAEIK